MKYFFSLLLVVVIPNVSLAGFVYTAEFPSSSTPPPQPPSTQAPAVTAPQGGGIVVVYGCTDKNATNYNPSATVKDASCVYTTEQNNTSNTCTVTFTKYQQLGTSGDEVVKIKNFLRTKEGYVLNNTKTYDLELYKAVKSFQEKYRPKVLSPWELLMPTGYWYKSTRKMANEILGCPEPAVLLDNGFLLK